MLDYGRCLTLKGQNYHYGLGQWMHLSSMLPYHTAIFKATILVEKTPGGRWPVSYSYRWDEACPCTEEVVRCVMSWHFLCPRIAISYIRKDENPRPHHRQDNPDSVGALAVSQLPVFSPTKVRGKNLKTFHYSGKWQNIFLYIIFFFIVKKWSYSFTLVLYSSISPFLCTRNLPGHERVCVKFSGLFNRGLAADFQTCMQVMYYYRNGVWTSA